MSLVLSSKILEHFSELSDPRRDNSRHLLLDIWVISLCAVICGADGWEDIADYGQSKREWFAQFLELPHGIPSHDTFQRVLSSLDPEELASCFLQWTRSISELSQGEIIAIDGKTLRRSFDRSCDKTAIHMVSAWANTNRLVLGQVKVDEKSNEITAIPQLLKMLEIQGCIVTIDAMGCQKEIATTIVDQEADYVLALKGNQGLLHEEIQLFFEDVKNHEFQGIPHDFHETIDGDHGRIEIRRHWIISDIDWLADKPLWKNLHRIGMVEALRDTKEKVTTETRFYITSLPEKAKLFAHAVREHWGIENSLHWVLDIAFREDESRIRKDNGAQNFASLRHIALNLLKQESSNKRGIKAKRLRAGWDQNYLFRDCEKITVTSNGRHQQCRPPTK